MKTREEILKYKKDYRIKNREKINQEKKEYRVKNKEKIKEYNKHRPRKNNYKYKKYNLTPEEYTEMFNNQNGCCAICGTHQNKLKKQLSIDHNHVTGKIRGLLCQKCNQGLGFFNDNINSLNQAISYLNNDN
jgi:hypothetical protein